MRNSLWLLGLLLLLPPASAPPGFLDSNLMPIMDNTPRILFPLHAPAALGLIDIGLAGVWTLRRSVPE